MAPQIPIEELTISAAHSAFLSGSYTSADLTSAYLSRIETLDQSPTGPHLNSILCTSPTALEEAAALDAELKKTGKLVGPLHGIPVIVKDQCETKNMPTTFGCIAAKDWMPADDATLVKKLKAAGAIILAKSTMPDWATGWFSTSSLSGVTHNPYNVAHDVGGSSSGTGVAVSANLGMIGVGEDTGGSIRLPSSFNGLVGLRPTPGLISRKGLCPLIKQQDTPGPMTRTVTDAALMLDVMAGFDPEDPYTATAVIAGPPLGGSYAAALDEKTISVARIGVIRSMFGAESDKEGKAVNRVITAALDKLTKAGATLVDVEIPKLKHYVDFTPTYVSGRSKVDINNYLKNTNPPIGITAESVFSSKQFHPKLDLFADIASGPDTPAGDPLYAQRLEDREDLVMSVIGIMEGHKLDTLAFPDAKIPAPLHTDVDRYGAFDFPTNTLLGSQLRMPAITVPAGFTEEGLPVGLEFVCMPYAEQKALGLAYGVEQLLKARKAPPL